jgi:uncharacterized protein
MSDDTNLSAPQLPEGTLLEGVVTTINADGSPHVAPMGPIIDSAYSRIHLRPYQTSTTYQNLKRTRQGVLHVTDDVEMFARAAVGQLQETPRLFTAKAVNGVILADACRWHAFQVESIDDRNERTSIVATIVEYGRIRDFFGFNRAKHAVIEAAILATRIEFLDAPHIRSEYKRLAGLVEKTGGHSEHAAFEFLQRYLDERYADADRAEATS